MAAKIAPKPEDKVSPLNFYFNIEFQWLSKFLNSMINQSNSNGIIVNTGL